MRFAWLVSNHGQAMGKGKVASIYIGACFPWRDKYTHGTQVCQVYQPWERGLKHFTCMLPHMHPKLFLPVTFSDSNFLCIYHLPPASYVSLQFPTFWLNQLANSSPYTGLESPLELQEPEAPGSFWQRTHESVKEVSSSHRPPLPQEIYLVLIYVSSWVDSRPQEIKPVNFRLVEQSFNTLRHLVPRLTPPPWWYYV